MRHFVLVALLIFEPIIGVANEASGNCANDQEHIVKGSAFLQAKHRKHKQKLIRNCFIRKSFDLDPTCVSPTLQDSHLLYFLDLGDADESSIDADTASLDAGGFFGVTSLCCPPQTEQFFKRLLEFKGLQVCSWPHVQGLVHWFTCVPDMDFQYLIDIIDNGNPCKYWSPVNQSCPILEPPCDGTWCTSHTSVTATTDVPTTTATATVTAIVTTSTFTSTATTATTSTTPMVTTTIAPQTTTESTASTTTDTMPTTTLTTTTFTTTITTAPTATTIEPTIATTTTIELTTTTTETTSTIEPATTSITSSTLTTATSTTTTTTTTTSGTTTTTTTIRCCKDYELKISTVQAMKRVQDALGSMISGASASADVTLTSIEPWDCTGKDIFPIQVLTDDSTGSFTNVSKLNVVTGEYELLYQIPTTATTPEMRKFINGAAINPVDNISYATVPIDGKDYVIRFDSDSIEFVAQVPSASVDYGYSKDGYFIGSFGWDGAYYFGGRGLLLALPEVATMQGFASQSDAPVLGTSDVQKKDAFQGVADLVVFDADLDGTGVNQWISGLKGNGDMIIGKLPADGNIANVAVQTLDLSAQSLALSNEGKKSFGAGWNYQDGVFFSRNNGDGVFQIDLDSIDLGASTFSMTLVGPSAVTANNDGMNCYVPFDPWSGSCYVHETEVDPECSNGTCTCPEGARQSAR